MQINRQKLTLLAILFILLLGILHSSNKNTTPDQPSNSSTPTIPSLSPTAPPLTPTPTHSAEPTYSEPSPTPPSTAEPTYLVTRVLDGDTIQIETGETIRYIGIDTPETVHPNKPVMCFGLEASAKNKQLVLGKRVRLEKDVSHTDKYKRLLRYVWLDGILINQELVHQGYAQASTYPPDVKYQSLFTAAQKYAKDNKLGLWDKCKYFGEYISPTKSASPSSTQDCSIKGNISASGEKIYHLPGCGSYTKTVIDQSQGERYFCNESQAQSAGWRKAKNCP